MFKQSKLAITIELLALALFHHGNSHKTKQQFLIPVQVWSIFHYQKVMTSSIVYFTEEPTSMTQASSMLIAAKGINIQTCNC